MKWHSGLILRCGLVLAGLTSVAYVFWDCTVEKSDGCFTQEHLSSATHFKEICPATVSSHSPIVRFAFHCFDRQREPPRFHTDVQEDQHLQRRSPTHRRATRSSYSRALSERIHTDPSDAGRNQAAEADPPGRILLRLHRGGGGRVANLPWITNVGMVT